MAILAIGFVLYLIELVKDINHTRELRTKRNLLRKEREDSDSGTDFTTKPELVEKLKL